MLQGWGWWKSLFGGMTGGGGDGGVGRCQRRRKMMGRGAEGGCGTEEKTCPISIPRVPLQEITENPSTLSEITKLPPKRNLEIDLYSQALKALSQRSPFDSEEAQVSCAPPTLPSGLAHFLTRHSDSRKRHKKLHSGPEKKSSARPEKARGSAFWQEAEAYFRELTVDDIEKLRQLSSTSFSGDEKCFLIPALCNEIVPSAGNPGEICADSGVLVKEEEVNEENGEGQQFMDVDNVGGGNNGNELHKEDKGEKACSSSSSSSFSGTEWLLGSRSKVYLTSERPSKRRKLLGGDAGLEKLLVASPVEGSDSLCHCCSLGDTGDQLNRLIICGSCGMVVHQRCYGVQEDLDGTWFCSWCKRKNELRDSERPCLLCTKKGGALKLIGKRASGSEGGSDAEFAHLFCSQWIPEVYVENTRTMEPIMNVDGITETRKKLICYLCKVKFGACVRCSNGACRTSFHPICAREARHRMEIWGKLGCDDVELRAFCLKHSEGQSDGGTQQGREVVLPNGSGSDIIKHQTAASTANHSRKVKIGQKNGDKVLVQLDTASLDSARLEDDELHAFSPSQPNSEIPSECVDSQKSVNGELLDRTSSEDVNAYDSLNFTVLLKKLIDRGKVNVKDLASEIGASPDSLASMLKDNHISPDLRDKIVKWLRNNAYISSLEKNVRVRIKSTVAPKAEASIADDTSTVRVTESDMHDVVPVKSVPPRRRTKNNIRVIRDDKLMCAPKNMTEDDAVRGDPCGAEDQNHLSKQIPPDGTNKNLSELLRLQDTKANNSYVTEDEPSKVLIHSLSGGQTLPATISKQGSLMDSEMGVSLGSIALHQTPHLSKSEALSNSYVHPLILNNLTQITSKQRLKDMHIEFDGSTVRSLSELEASSSSGTCCAPDSHLPGSVNVVSNGANYGQLVKAKNMGLLELSPADEVEGELIYYQHQLLRNTVARKRFTDGLMYKVVRSLQQEIDTVRDQKWNAVLVTQYLNELKEAKKQGRKERRHKEAQAVLAAATAAAAASSRISSLRKDMLEESVREEDLAKVTPLDGRPALYSLQSARPSEALSSASGAQLFSESTSDVFQLTSDSSRECPRTCDVCRRSESMLNPILVCSSCKVAVHLDCYRSVKSSAGPWHCELCEDLLASGRTPATASWDKPGLFAECGLCGGTAGAFRKTLGGLWVHAFCAEWVLESTFRRGQVHPIEGVETIRKGNDVCLICRHRQGVCIKCNYGHCQSTFHPSCGKSAGFYMTAKTIGGSKLQHKGYCERHSLEQRAKAASQKHGIEELKSLKQVRVELERLRLLCERIIKREKLKRELLLCSQDILASNRDNVVFSALTSRPISQLDGSSESATTTSFKGYTDGYKSGSETMQRSDDITVDSTVAGKRRVRFPMSIDNDQKTDDSSMSQNIYSQKPMQRIQFSGKQIPYRANMPLRDLSDDGEKRSKYRKHTETFEKELVMTSDQASIKNQRLPKGYVYVPIRSLSDEKETSTDECFQKPVEHD